MNRIQRTIVTSNEGRRADPAVRSPDGVILITGASGRVARRTAELLADAGHRLRLMTRDPRRAPQLVGAETVRGDFAQPATLKDAFAGVSAALVVSASGEPGERALLHRNAFQAAAHARVGHVVYLSLQGAAPDSKYPFSRDHALSEQFLFAAGLPCTVLRNAFYLDMFLEKFDAEGVIRGPAQQGRGAFVSREDVARNAAAVLRKQPGGIYDVTGPEALSVDMRMSPPVRLVYAWAGWKPWLGGSICPLVGSRRSRQANWSAPTTQSTVSPEPRR